MKSNRKKLVIPVFIPHLGCPNDCSFCNQKSISGKSKMPTKEEVVKIIETYLDSIKDEKIYVEIWKTDESGITGTKVATHELECLSVFGNDYPTPDGSCIRDYIDVVDLAKAHVAAITRMVEGKNKQNYEIFNVGTGKGTSVLELVEMFQRVNNLKLNYKIAPRRQGDVVSIYADTSLANNELGWKAERSLEDTLVSAWKWEQYIRRK